MFMYCNYEMNAQETKNMNMTVTTAGNKWSCCTQRVHSWQLWRF